MNSIRPLFTITILVVVAIYLYLKINDEPGRPVADRSPLQETADGVPPLEAIDTDENAVDAAAEMAEAATPAEGDAPTWNGEQDIAASPDATASEESMPATLPAVPEIPALPEVAAPVDATSAPSALDVAESQLPKNIPLAKYPGESSTGADEAGAAPMSETPGASVPVPSGVHDGGSATDTAPTANAETPSSIPALPSTPGSLTDRYGNPIDAASGGATASLSATTTPGSETFAASWPAIQAALDQGELARAHQLLSPWYANSALTHAEQQQVETLLGQLAGTVVYSTEHQLEPAHVVQAGETLETIAAKYNVPWQLLAKINGVASVDSVQPGQQLKVMRGPFSAVLNLAKNEVCLNLDGRYAGRFPIVVPNGVQANNGEWMVMQKIEAPNGGSERALMLRPLTPSTTGEPSSLVLGAAKPEVTGAEANSGRVIGMIATDANEIADILSVGSRVQIRR